MVRRTPELTLTTAEAVASKRARPRKRPGRRSIAPVVGTDRSKPRSVARSVARWVAAWVLGAAVSPCAGQVVFEGAILDSAGRVEAARIAAVRIPGGGKAAEVSVVDERGRAAARPAGELLALAPIEWTMSAEEALAPRAAAGPFIELTDGQRFAGRPGPLAAPGESIAWVHHRFGTLHLAVENIARVVMRPEEFVARNGAGGGGGGGGADAFWLLNGDRIEGFLESVGPSAGGRFVFSIDAGGARMDVPVDQVIEARFANPARAAAGPVAWLADGSIVAIASAETDAGGTLLINAAAVKAEPSEAPAAAAFSPAEVLAIALDARRIVPLAGLAVASYRPIGLPRRPGPRVVGEGPGAGGGGAAPLGASDIVLPGPMEVEWALPAGVRRIAGTLRLDDADWAWGECAVVVELAAAGSSAGEGFREIARAELGGQSASANLSVELASTDAGDRLRVRVEAGELGPIRDRVRLERVLLLR